MAWQNLLDIVVLQATSHPVIQPESAIRCRQSLWQVRAMAKGSWLHLGGSGGASVPLGRGVGRSRCATTAPITRPVSAMKGGPSSYVLCKHYSMGSHMHGPSLVGRSTRVSPGIMGTYIIGYKVRFNSDWFLAMLSLTQYNDGFHPSLCPTAVC